MRWVPVLLGVVCLAGLVYLVVSKETIRQDRGEVKGVVRLDGQLVETGSISFRPKYYASGLDAGAEIIDGKYHIPARQGPSVGEMVVQFTGTRKTNNVVSVDDRLQNEWVELFPAHYRTDTTLLREIKPGLNVHDFDLTTKTPADSATAEPQSKLPTEQSNASADR